MCEIVENYAKETAKEENMLMAKKLLEMGVDFDTVLHSAENITFEELKEIYNGVKKNSV